MQVATKIVVNRKLQTYSSENKRTNAIHRKTSTASDRPNTGTTRQEFLKKGRQRNGKVKWRAKARETLQRDALVNFGRLDLWVAVACGRRKTMVMGWVLQMFKLNAIRFLVHLFLLIFTKVVLLYNAVMSTTFVLPNNVTGESPR